MLTFWKLYILWHLTYVVWHWRLKTCVALRFKTFIFIRYETLTLWNSYNMWSYVNWCLCCVVLRFVGVPLLRMLYTLLCNWRWKNKRASSTLFCLLQPPPPSPPPVSPPSESIEWFIEGQASSPSHDLAPRPPLSPLSRLVNSASDTQEDCERETTCWRKRGKGWRVERGAES